MSLATTQRLKTTNASAPVRNGRTAWLHVLGGAILLAVVTFAVYSPALHGGFILDDEDLLQRCGQATWQQIWFSTTLPDYWPLTESMLRVEWGMWGYQTLGYHIVNVLLHLGATVMVWRILKLLLVPGAFVAALLFAIHPVNVESVAWIVQRKNTLSMFWFLASAYFYVRMEQGSDSRRQTGRFYWLSLTSFVLALLSKIAVVVLPPLLLLIIWWKRPVTRRDVLRLIPFFALAAFFSIVNMWFMAHANAEGIRSASLLQRILGAGAVTWFYLSKAILPTDLAFIYPKWEINSSQWLWFVPVFATVVTTAVLWLVRKSAVGRALFVGWLFFCIALLPVMGLSDTGFMKFSLVADHYQHIAIIGVMALAGAALSHITKYKLQVGIIALIVAALSLKAAQQATIYRDAITLYRAAVDKNPTSWILHGNLADELLTAGQIEPAIIEFRETLRLNPQSDDAHYFFGEALLRAGAVDDAVVQFNETIKLPVERYHFKAYHGLAEIYLSRGDNPQALAMERKAQDIAREHGLDQIVAQTEGWIQAMGLK
ncbi:MAG: tetratricopeptide repeat protein [Limisphaerales bacterium]